MEGRLRERGGTRTCPLYEYMDANMMASHVPGILHILQHHMPTVRQTHHSRFLTRSAAMCEGQGSEEGTTKIHSP